MININLWRKNGRGLHDYTNFTIFLKLIIFSEYNNLQKIKFVI